jgi:NADH:ubiquinone oxidoreductase subunit B-like Fe-S oxidoreductase
MNLRVRVVRCPCTGGHHWYADIDDADDLQPDDPFWFVDGCPTQSRALEIACAQLTFLADPGRQLTRVQEAHLVHV